MTRWLRASAPALLILALLAAVLLAVRPQPVAAQDARERTRTETATMPADHGGQACAHCHESPHEEGVSSDCASCHVSEDWSPSTFTLARHMETAFPLHGLHAEVECGLCHTGGSLKGLEQECSGCHTDPHRGIVGGECESCHSVEGFSPVADFNHAEATGFALTGPHAGPSCASCHEGSNGAAMRLTARAECSTCHQSSHATFSTKGCTDCHAPEDKSFASPGGDFDHRTTGFDLERRHGVQSCASCHPAGSDRPSARCSECHMDPHSGQLGMQCDDCHRPDRWRLARFDHDIAWPLRGRHFVASCADCHTGQRWIGLTTECWDCHAMDAAAAPQSIEQHGFGRADCSNCHSTWTFEL